MLLEILKFTAEWLILYSVLYMFIFAIFVFGLGAVWIVLFGAGYIVTAIALFIKMIKRFIEVI